MSFPPQQSADTVTKSRKIPKSRVYCPNKQKPHKKRTLFPKASKKKSENALNKSTHTQSRLARFVGGKAAQKPSRFDNENKRPGRPAGHPPSGPGDRI